MFLEEPLCIIVSRRCFVEYSHPFTIEAQMLLCRFDTL